MNKKTISVKKIGNFLEIDGKWYFPKQHSPKDRGKAIIFREVDKKIVEDNLKFLVNTLKPYLDGKMVLEDAIADLKPTEITKLFDALKTGKKPTVKRKYGCVDMVVNGITIPIR
jgi:hypothetical protein